MDQVSRGVTGGQDLTEGFWRAGTLCPFVCDTVVPYLSTVMSRLRGDISLVIRISTITE